MLRGLSSYSSSSFLLANFQKPQYLCAKPFYFIPIIRLIWQLDFDLVRTSVLEISKQDGERRTSQDRFEGLINHARVCVGSGGGPTETPKHPARDPVPWDAGSEVQAEVCFLPLLLLWPFAWAGGAQRLLCLSLPSPHFSHSPNSLPEWIEINWIRVPLFLDEFNLLLIMCQHLIHFQR